jgi:hypothetical protein
MEFVTSKIALNQALFANRGRLSECAQAINLSLH